MNKKARHRAGKAATGPEVGTSLNVERVIGLISRPISRTVCFISEKQAEEMVSANPEVGNLYSLDAYIKKYDPDGEEMEVSHELSDILKKSVSGEYHKRIADYGVTFVAIGERDPIFIAPLRGHDEGDKA